jgi:hypothetical protein
MGRFTDIKLLRRHALHEMFQGHRVLCTVYATGSSAGARSVRRRWMPLPCATGSAKADAGDGGVVSVCEKYDYKVPDR